MLSCSQWRDGAGVGARLSGSQKQELNPENWSWLELSEQHLHWYAWWNQTNKCSDGGFSLSVMSDLCIYCICEVLFPNQSLDTAVSWLQLKIETLKTHKNNSWRAEPYVWVFSYSNTGTGAHVLAFECPWARKEDQKPARDYSSFLQIDVVTWKMETGVQTLTTTY